MSKYFGVVLALAMLLSGGCNRKLAPTATTTPPTTATPINPEIKVDNV